MTRIGILTSGGDCPGLNAVISAVVKCASRKNWEVYGIPFATEGFMQLARGENKPEDFILRDHGYDIPGFLKGLDVLQFLSGSILGSLSSGRPVMEDIIKGYEILGLNALIAVGGDGSLDIIYNIAKKGNWNLVAIPKTIDNDVPYTERSVGFDTAVNTVTKAIYDLTFTAASHERVMIVEVMGRDAGHLALHSGIAGGADIILIPELTPQLNESIVDQCCHKIAEIRSRNLRKFALIVIAEGVRNHERQRIKYIGDYLGSWIKSHSKELCGSGNKSFCDFDELDTRVTVLGHLQRSGTPSSFDRILATAFGIKAVNLIEEQKYYQLVVWRNGKVESESLDEVLPILRKVRTEKGCAYPVEPHGSMVETAKSLGIYVGND